MIVEDLKAQYQFTVTVPHELGHQLGAPHDGPENKKYPGCPPKGAIMAAFMDGSSGDVYSPCSLDSITDLLEAMTDAAYIMCINVRNLTADYLQVQQHLPPPKYSHKEFCQATAGKNYYSSICLYGSCVPCTRYQPQWKDCEKL
ncbi:A disintegrin and metalloproteinase with thrombospondin motifs 10-like isoform X2 [Haemaphysalis longicornis]